MLFIILSILILSQGAFDELFYDHKFSAVVFSMSDISLET